MKVIIGGILFHQDNLSLGNSMEASKNYRETMIYR